MKKLVFTLFILITCVSTQLEARIVFGHDNIQNLLAAHNFNREEYGHIVDKSVHGINGVLDGNAKLIKGKFGNSLSLEDTDSRFIALKTAPGPYYIDLYANHAISVWVKVPKQETDFTISLQFIDFHKFAVNSDIPIAELETVAGTQLTVKPNGNIGAVSHSIFFDDIYDPHEWYDDTYVEEPLDLPDPSVKDHDEPTTAQEKSFFSNGHHIETKDQSINDDSWHHIALVHVHGSPAGYLKLYVDSELVYENEYSFGYLWEASSYITLITVGDGATGVVDDLCFFYQALDEAYIDVLYELGLDKIMTVADVAAKNKLTTTWGDMKSQR